MPKFKLIAEHTDAYGQPTDHKVTSEFTTDFLPDVLENIQLFLRGVGFVSDGDLEFVGAEIETHQEPHSEYYYDYTRNQPL
jgi:hypothetical protein